MGKLNHTIIPEVHGQPKFISLIHAAFKIYLPTFCAYVVGNFMDSRVMFIVFFVKFHIVNFKLPLCTLALTFWFMLKLKITFH